jgi:hypothetical protein
MIGAYEAGFLPYADFIERIVLPPRGKCGSAVNKKRALLVQAALHQFKAGKFSQGGSGHSPSKCRLCAVRVKLRPVGK